MLQHRQHRQRQKCIYLCKMGEIFLIQYPTEYRQCMDAEFNKISSMNYSVT